MKVLILGGTGCWDTSCSSTSPPGTTSPPPCGSRCRVHSPPALPIARPSRRGRARLDAPCRGDQAASPRALINCVGIVNSAERRSRHPVAGDQRPAASPAHALCGDIGARFVHFSTDCVFSGRRGQYTEADIRPIPSDLYGRTKLSGEVDHAPGLTLRTSIIGLEARQQTTDSSNGSSRSGDPSRASGKPSTRAHDGGDGRLVERIWRQPRSARPLHVASEPITKYDLLVDLRSGSVAAMSRSSRR